MAEEATSAASEAATGAASGAPAGSEPAGPMSYDASEARARAILAGVAALPRGDEAVQERAAAVIGLIDEMRVPSDRAFLLDLAELALRQLEAPPNLILCDRLIAQMQGRVFTGVWRRPVRAWASANPHLIVACGVLCATVIAVVIAHVVLPGLHRADLREMQMVTEAGFAGSLTSVMLRFNRWRGRGMTSRDAFFEGLFRPFIGVFFAWMVYYLLDAGILPLRAVAAGSQLHFHAGLAFVTGFSERLAVSFVDTLERRAQGA